MAANKLYFRVPDYTIAGSDNDGWVDAFSRYGIVFEETALSKLMTPAPNKEVVENKSDLEHGKRVWRDYNDIRKDERNVSLTFNIIASSKTDFMTKYGRFCDEILDKGFFDIKVSYWEGKVFRMTYQDCTQFTEFNQNIGKFVLNLNEPDPTNRDEENNW